MNFLSHVDKSGDCWLWLGAKDKDGYGRFLKAMAHRVSYQMHVKPIPAGLEIDHLCRNRVCVNPLHLEAVDRRTNCARTKGHRFTKTACKNGHAYSPENTYMRPDGSRDCRACIRFRVRLYKEKKA